jgi:hypothetical protein
MIHMLSNASINRFMLIINTIAVFTTICSLTREPDLTTQLTYNQCSDLLVQLHFLGKIFLSVL